MKSIYTELALYGTKNEGAKTEKVLFPISEVCDGTVSLKRIKLSIHRLVYRWTLFFL